MARRRPLDAYDLTLRGPNGFWRRFAGSLKPDAPRAEVAIMLHPDTGAAELIMRNGGTKPMVFTIALDEHYPTAGSRKRTVRVGAGTEAREHWFLLKSDHWFDFLVMLEGTPEFVRRFAGKIETGKPGRTDPGIGPICMTL